MRHLSKSQYVKGRKCLKRIWLHNFEKERAEAPSVFQAGIFEQGHLVGRLAHSLFPNGILVRNDHTDAEGARKQTEALIAAKVPAIFEAAFVYDGVLVRADIVAKNADDSWDLYEVKSSTSLKKEHLYDVALQKYVLMSSGLHLQNTHIVHLNSRYVRNGEIDIHQIFSVVRVDANISEQLEEVPGYVSTIRNALLVDTVCGAPPTLDRLLAKK